LSWKEASTKTSCLPYCLLTEAKEIKFQASRWSMVAGGTACYRLGAKALTLCGYGLDAQTVGEESLSGATVEVMSACAKAESRVLNTLDMDSRTFEPTRRKTMLA
jgi:hypothetical protein